MIELSTGKAEVLSHLIQKTRERERKDTSFARDTSESWRESWRKTNDNETFENLLQTETSLRVGGKFEKEVHLRFKSFYVEGLMFVRMYRYEIECPPLYSLFLNLIVYYVVTTVL